VLGSRRAAYCDSLADRHPACPLVGGGLAAGLFGYLGRHFSRRSVLAVMKRHLNFAAFEASVIAEVAFPPRHSLTFGRNCSLNLLVIWWSFLVAVPLMIVRARAALGGPDRSNGPCCCRCTFLRAARAKKIVWAIADTYHGRLVQRSKPPHAASDKPTSRPGVFVLGA